MKNEKKALWEGIGCFWIMIGFAILMGFPTILEIIKLLILKNK